MNRLISAKLAKAAFTINKRFTELTFTTDITGDFHLYGEFNEIPKEFIHSYIHAIEYIYNNDNVDIECIYNKFFISNRYVKTSFKSLNTIEMIGLEVILAIGLAYKNRSETYSSCGNIVDKITYDIIEDILSNSSIMYNDFYIIEQMSSSGLSFKEQLEYNDNNHIFESVFNITSEDETEKLSLNILINVFEVFRKYFGINMNKTEE